MDQTNSEILKTSEEISQLLYRFIVEEISPKYPNIPVHTLATPFIEWGFNIFSSVLGEEKAIDEIEALMKILRVKIQQGQGRLQ